MDPDQPLVRRAVALHLLVAPQILAHHRDYPVPCMQAGALRTEATSIQRPYSRYQDSQTQYQGVSHKRSGRWQAHLCHQSRQVHLGIFDHEVQAACAHDVAAIKFKQQDARTNFPLSLYQDTFVHWNMMTEEELVRCQLGSTKSSKYVGVNKNKNSGKWEARYPLSKKEHGGGSKYVNLGLRTLEVEAAEAYDREAIRRRGRLAVTNFGITHYPELLAEVEATGLSSNESHAGSNDPSKTREPDVAEETVDWIPANLFYTQVAGTDASHTAMTAMRHICTGPLGSCAALQQSPYRIVIGRNVAVCHAREHSSSVIVSHIQKHIDSTAGNSH